MVNALERKAGDPGSSPAPEYNVSVSILLKFSCKMYKCDVDVDNNDDHLDTSIHNITTTTLTR